MLRMIALLALLIVTMLAETEGRDFGHMATYTDKDRLISEIVDMLGVGTEDDLGKVKRDSDDSGIEDDLGIGKRGDDHSSENVSMAAELALSYAVGCIMRETMLTNVPEEIVDNEWNESYKDDEWFKNNKVCSIAIYNAMNYIKKPEQRTKIDAIMTAIKETMDCSFVSVSTTMRTTFIENLALNKTDGTEGEYAFPPEYRYVGIALEILQKRCAKQEKANSEFEASLWQVDNSSEQTFKRELQAHLAFPVLADSQRRDLGETSTVTAAGFEIIMFGAVSLVMKLRFNRTNSYWEKQINAMRVYIEALIRGDEDQVKSYDQSHENKKHTRTCNTFKNQVTNIDQELLKDTLIQRFLVANDNFVSGFRELITTHCTQPEDRSTSKAMFGRNLQ